MEPSRPLTPALEPAAAPSLFVRALAPIRAGAFAAGGSLVALAVAVSIERFPLWYRLPFFGWLTATLVSAALSVRYGYPDPTRGVRAHFERALGVVLFGLAWGAAVLWPIIEYLPRPSQDTESVAVLASAGALMLLIARVTKPKLLPDAQVPDGPGGLLPPPPVVEQAGSYALAANGPAITAEESERDAPAVEVRVLWGGDVLAVRHLAPPRSYHLGNAGADFVVDGEPLGAARFPIVLADRGGVCAVAPRDAGAMIHTGPGKQRSLEQALAEGIAEPYEGVAPGTRIPLAQGARVAITLPSRAAGTAYRAAPGEGAAAALVIEVALVRAGRVVGRTPSLGSGARLLASTAVAAGVMLGGLHVAGTRPGPDVDEDDGMTVDQKYEMVRAFQAVMEREIDEEEARAQERMASMTPEERDRERRLRDQESWNAPTKLPGRERLRNSFDELERRPFDSFGEIDMIGPGTYCFAVESMDQGPGPNAPFATDPRIGLCQTAVVTPFGLRSLGAPPSIDVLGRDPTDRWAFDFARMRYRPIIFDADRTARAIAAARVEIEPLTRPDAFVDRWMVDRALRRRMADLRACYALGLRLNPDLEGSVDVAANVGIDGRTHTYDTLHGAGMPDALVSRCVVSAIEGMVVSPPPPHARSWPYRVHLRGSDDKPRKSLDRRASE
jgi:hypothetical protein